MSANYNGWTNYATWRVNLEIFDGMSARDITGRSLPSVSDLKDALKDHAEGLIYDMGGGNGNIAVDYALAFLSDVNWWEIANNMLVGEEDEENEDEDETYDSFGVNTKNSFNTPPKHETR
jgi:hypothetical protein